jgi:hypothetical protein
MSGKNVTIAQLFAKTRTVCIGRFLIDVPQESEIVYGPAWAPWEINAYAGKGARFDALLAERLSEIEGEKRFAQGELREKDSLVGVTIPGAHADQKIVFGVSKAGGMIYQIDSYIKVNDGLFVQRADPIPEDREAVVQDLKSVATRIRSRPELEIPMEPGVCIEGAFISDAKESGFEEMNLGVRLSRYPDVHFSLSLTKKDALVASDALAPRIEQAGEVARKLGQGAWYSRIKTLRRGDRAIGKWKGYEILARKPSQGAVGESHEFAFLSQGEAGNPLLPVLEMEMHSGVRGNQLGRAKPSVSDEDAVAIWDKLTASIRPRPTGALPTKKEASAGQRCPYSGWWECTDGDRHLLVQGGRRQHFAEGSLMPNATLLGAPSLWQKIKSEQPRYRTENASVWALVELDRAKEASVAIPAQSDTVVDDEPDSDSTIRES